MKNLIVLGLTLMLFIPLKSWAMESAESSSGRLGLGVVFGDPTGLSVSYKQDSRNEFDGGLAYSFSNFVLIFADYHVRFQRAFSSTSLASAGIVPYLGVGGVLFVASQSQRTNGTFFSNSSSAGFGVRIPFGAEWFPRQTPLGIFAELVPGLGLVPGVFGFFQGGVGIRYYF